MCGIVGSVNYKNINHSEILNTISHRGPDFQSSYISNNVWLGHVRLSIIDLSSHANQPIQFDENYTLVFNGEIYNYKELGLKYLNKVFTSDSIFLYEFLITFDNTKKRFEIIKEFRGMWAFSFFDKTKNQLLLVRDLFGKKPLYYHKENERFIFASEIKPISKILNRDSHLNEIVLQESIKYRFSLYESPYIGIDMLKKGHYAIYDINQNIFEIKEYFNTFDLIKDNKPYALESSNVERIENTLIESVKYRMVSDVKVGTITSGGLDSSLISSIAHKINDRLELFHVDVNGESETKYAKILSEDLNSKLHISNFFKENFTQDYEKSLEYYEYPMIHPNNIALLGLSKLAKNASTKVLLSGEGADEIFGGYSNSKMFDKFLTIFSLFLMKQPKMRFLFSEIFDFDFTKFLLISPKEKNFLPIEIEMEKIFQKYYDYYCEFYNKKNALYCSYLALQFEYYTKPILLRADKMFMANSIELRSPFFDTKVVQEGLLIHPNLRKDKKIIREIAKKYISKDIIYRKKVGFNVPYYKSLEYKKIYQNDELNFISDSFYRLG